jgi:hypothetical protein
MPQLRNLLIALLCAVVGGCSTANDVGFSLPRQVLSAQPVPKVGCPGPGCEGSTKPTVGGIKGANPGPVLASERELVIEERPTAVAIYDVDSLPCLERPCSVENRFRTLELLLNQAKLDARMTSDGETYDILTTHSLFNLSLQFVDGKCRDRKDNSTDCPASDNHPEVGATGQPHDPLPGSRDKHCVTERKFRVVSSELRVRIPGYDNQKSSTSSERRRDVYVLLYVRQICEGRMEPGIHNRSVPDHLKALGIRLPRSQK